MNTARLLTLLLCVCLLLTAGPFAQPPGSGDLLRVAYLRPRGETSLTAERMEELRAALAADDALQRELAAADLDGIGLFEIDGARDFLLRLNAGEFDLAFVPARLWAEQTAGYTVILQTRGEQDTAAARGRLVLRRGVVFVSPRSPLFAEDEPSPDQVAVALREGELAAVATQSMAGYVAPMLALAETGALAPESPPRMVWFDSGAEAARAVVSGLADIGVCEESALSRTLEEAPVEGDQLARVILRSVPVPSDPVVVRPELAPGDSALGRELKRALQDFARGGGLDGVALQNAQDDDYVETRALLRRWEARAPGVRP